MSAENVELVTRWAEVMRSKWDSGGPWREVLEPFFELEAGSD
jgi:hypothetical protein